jgi:CheY-like chemotaxis protein
MLQILIGEDNPADIYLLRVALEEHGVTLPLQVVTDGREVMRLLDQQEEAEDHFKLIILDLNLPCFDGLELLRRIQLIEGLRGVPVIILTSSDSPRERLAGMNLGATRFLQKPTSLDQFLSLGGIFKELIR